MGISRRPGLRRSRIEGGELGDDADTTGAICGQLAGAYWGESGIPQSWRERLAKRGMIEETLANEVVNLNRPPKQRAREFGEQLRSLC